MLGHLYILTNQSMPGLIKVGHTTKPMDQRMKELHSTGVPTPFILEFYIEVGNSRAAEKIIHDSLFLYRNTKNREFFKISAKETILRIVLLFGDNYYKIPHKIKYINPRVFGG